MENIKAQKEEVQRLYNEYLSAKDKLREMESSDFMKFDPNYIFIVQFRREWKFQYADSFPGAIKLISEGTGEDKYLNVSKWGVSEEYGDTDDIPVYDGDIVFKYTIDPNYLDGNVWIIRVPLFRLSLSENSFAGVVE